VREICQELNIPPLGSYGICEADVPVLVEKASQASSMKANPIPLTPDELREVLARAL
jgi:alcohol dehydrogenase class IV